MDELFVHMNNSVRHEHAVLKCIHTLAQSRCVRDRRKSNHSYLDKDNDILITKF